eukprot:13701164-Alexandrium_andersonii.AAC.1
MAFVKREEDMMPQGLWRAREPYDEKRLMRDVLARREPLVFIGTTTPMAGDGTARSRAGTLGPRVDNEMRRYLATPIAQVTRPTTEEGQATDPVEPTGQQLKTQRRNQRRKQHAAEAAAEAAASRAEPASSATAGGSGSAKPDVPPPQPFDYKVDPRKWREKVRQQIRYIKWATGIYRTMADAVDHSDPVLNCPGGLLIDHRKGSGKANRLSPSDIPRGRFGLKDCAGSMALLLQHRDFGTTMANAVCSTPAPTKSLLAKMQSPTPKEDSKEQRLSFHVSNMAMVSRAC